MQTASQIINENKTILPESVLKALSLNEGDAIVFEIDQTGVRIKKAMPVQISYAGALQGTLTEWNSEFDDEAYADL